MTENWKCPVRRRQGTRRKDLRHGVITVVPWNPTPQQVVEQALAEDSQRAVIIGSIAMNDRACAWAGVRARAIRMLGLMTYPLYLLHQTVGSAVVLTLHDHGIPRFPALFFAIAICLAVSWIIASALEPGLKRHLQLTFARIEASLRRGARIAFLFQPTKPPAT